MQILKIKQSQELLQFAHKVHVTLYKMRGPFSNQESQLQPRKKKRLEQGNIFFVRKDLVLEEISELTLPGKLYGEH